MCSLACSTIDRSISNRSGTLLEGEEREPCECWPQVGPVASLTYIYIIFIGYLKDQHEKRRDLVKPTKGSPLQRHFVGQTSLALACHGSWADMLINLIRHLVWESG